MEEHAKIMNMNMRVGWEENSADDVDPTDSRDHSNNDSSSRSMVSFEIALHETTWETCLLDSRNSYTDYHDDDDDETIMRIRRKYPWRRFQAFLKRAARCDTSNNNKKFLVVSTSVVFLFFLVAGSSSSSISYRRQRQQQQQQSVQQSFAELQRNVIEHDYFATDREYVSDYAPISHKCLFGNDDACTCPEFNPREASADWFLAHEANSKQLVMTTATAASNKSNIAHDEDEDDTQQHDVIFVGNDLVALWAGQYGNTTTMTSTTTTTSAAPTSNAKNKDQDGETTTTAQFVYQYFQQTFTKAGGGDVNGLALGIAGDTTSALRWRFKNGELPPQAQAKIWWLSIGINDLDLTTTRSGCSEEATLLGIVRAAQDIMYHKKHADGSVHVVIQALLPLRGIASSSSSQLAARDNKNVDKRSNGSSSSNWFSSWLFHKKNRIETDDNDDDAMFRLLWPSIQNINKQLAIFCQKHDGLVFFDPSTFSMDSSNSGMSSMTRNQAAHLSVEGYKLLGDAIHNEVLRIIRNQ